MPRLIWFFRTWGSQNDLQLQVTGSMMIYATSKHVTGHKERQKLVGSCWVKENIDWVMWRPGIEKESTSPCPEAPAPSLGIQCVRSRPSSHLNLSRKEWERREEFTQRDMTNHKQNPNRAHILKATGYTPNVLAKGPRGAPQVSCSQKRSQGSASTT